MKPLFYPIYRATLSLPILFMLSALTFQSQAQSGSVTTTQNFSYTGQIVAWTVPTGVTSLTVEARGAEGGDVAGRKATAGKGAILAASVIVTPGQSLSILVGQQLSGKSAGGGGSFVVGPGSPGNPTPLVIAGGGGGASFSIDSPAKHGQTTAGGGSGAGAGAGIGGAGGAGGAGGGGSFGTGGGGGLLGNGGGFGGKAFVNGGAGGSGGISAGSFGGGGGVGTGGTGAGGGGGGYSGGGGGDDGTGGGGGSFTAHTRLFARTGATDGNSGNGLVIISYAPQPPQPVRYVKQGGTSDGTSWDNASGDLQSQIDIAGAEQVWVAGGRYTRTGGGSFSLKNGVAVYGGFVGSEASLTDRPGINPVNGQPSSTTLTATSVSVFYNSDLTNTARLDGVVITGGNSSQGGGIFNISSSPMLTNCLISGNTAGTRGGGIYNNSSSPMLTNCLISGNTANEGGGIYNVSNSSVLTNCFITGNTAGSWGGGIYNSSSSPVLTNCVINANSAGSLGGGIYNNSSSPRLVNATMTQNRAGFGAALINYSGSQPVLTNCLLWDNQESAGTSINNDNGTGVTASYCLIGQGEADFTGDNNLTATDSPFVSSTDFTLRAGSQPIDAGDPNSSGSTDLAGNPRVFNGRIDQGAYEFQGPACQPVAITQQPVSGSAVCVGSTVTATVSVSGTNPTYQWYKDNLNNLLQGQNAATLTLTNVQPGDAGSYSVVVTGSCATNVTSTAFTLSITDPVAPSLQVSAMSTTNQPISVTASGCSGGTINWLPQGGTGQANGTIYTFSQPGDYTLSATCSQGNCTSPAAPPLTLSIRPGTPPPSGFAIVGVGPVRCETVTATERRLILTPQYTGVSGQPISFSVVNELLPTTAPAPYTIRLYIDNPAITLSARQGSAVASFRYNWLAACQTGTNPDPGPNRAPTTSGIPAQTLVQNQSYQFTLTDYFSDPDGQTLRFSTTTLPPGLTLNGSIISGTPSATGESQVSVTATDPGGLSASTSVSVRVNPATGTPPPSGFAIVGVSTGRCEVVTPTERRLTFTPQYSGQNSSPISFSVVGELLPTTQPGPYTIRLYIDNPAITLSARQGSAVAIFRYNWLAACQTGGNPNPGPNRAPTTSGIPAQTLVQNQPYQLTLTDYFSDPDGQTLRFSTTALPPGLSLSGTVISGTPSATGETQVSVTATDPGGLSASTSVSLRVNPATSTPPPSGFAITGVSTGRCEVVTPTERRLTFTPQYSGQNSSPISFSVVGELLPTTQPGPYTIRLYIDNPAITLNARQDGAVASFRYNWLAACQTGSNPNSRLAAGEPSADWQVVVLGNPVIGETIEVEVRGATGKTLRLETLSEQGYYVDQQGVEQARAVERIRLRVGPSAGVYLLRVSSALQSQTLKLLKR